MKTEQFSIQKLNRGDLDTLVNWAREEGWNPGPHDAEVFWNTDPEGFWGYFHQNELIAGGSIVSYEGLFGFMGFFIVRPDCRGLGIGRKLWKERRDLLLSRLQPGVSIGMDGVVAMQDFYQKGGFKLAFRDERHVKTGELFPRDKNISSLTYDDFEEVSALDQQCFGFPRHRFLKEWIFLPESCAFKYKTGDRIEGFTVLRKVTKGYKIGPLFAHHFKAAEALYQACLNAVPGEQVFLDIPVSNPDAVALTRKYNTLAEFECARMYYGKAPEQTIRKIFGITTFELG